VESKGGKETNDGVRRAFADEGKAVVFRWRVVWMDIESPSYPAKLAGTS